MREELCQLAARIRELREICGMSADEVARGLDVTPEVYA